MNQRFLGHCSLLILLVTLLQACRTTTLRKAPSSADKLLIQPLDFKYLAINSCITYQKDQQHYKVRVKFRIQKDSIIWFSAAAFWGIEVARGVIKPTGITFINRLQRVYQVYDYPTLQAQWRCPCSYALIQAVLLGELPFAYTPQEIMQPRAQRTIIQQQKGRWRLTTTINQAMSKVKKLAIVDMLTQDQYTICYKQFKQHQRGVLFRDAQIYLGQDTVTITHTSVHWPQKTLHFPFTIPPQYDKP